MLLRRFLVLKLAVITRFSFSEIFRVYKCLLLISYRYKTITLWYLKIFVYKTFWDLTLLVCGIPFSLFHLCIFMMYEKMLLKVIAQNKKLNGGSQIWNTILFFPHNKIGFFDKIYYCLRNRLLFFY